MAGDWIKMRTDLHEDPAVVALCHAIGMDSFGVVGRLHRLWSWFSAHTKDGHARGVTTSFVDQLCARESFGENLEKVGWLIVTSTGVRCPKFDRHLSQGAKQRALANRRKAKERSRKCHAANVTKTRPEKRREEKSIEEEGVPSSSCPETKQVSSSGLVAGQPAEVDSRWRFPVDGGDGSPFLVPVAWIDSWAAAFPSLDVPGEITRALVWVEADPGRRKTARGMKRFLSGWLDRSTNNGGRRQMAQSPRGDHTANTVQAVRNIEQREARKSQTLELFSGVEP